MLIFFWYCLDELDLILNDERMREDLADDTWNSYSTVQEAGRLGRFILDAEVLWEEMQISRRSSSEVEDVAEERGSLDTGVRRRSNLIAQEADRLIRLLDLSTEDEDTNSRYLYRYCSIFF